jgi:hypothetical protein
MDDLNRIWSQEELRQYLVDNGFPVENFGNEQIPQGAKYIDFSPLSDADFASAIKLMRANPQWQTR